MSLSGDRHLRPEPSGRLKGLIEGPRTVTVRAPETYARSFAGQVSLQMLINLLCRQFGVVDAVFLDVPSVPMQRSALCRGLPTEDDLVEQLVLLGSLVSGDEMRVVVARSPSPPAAVSVLLGPNVEPDLVHRGNRGSLVAHGDGWNAYCSSLGWSPDSHLGSSVPFGPILAACLAAGKVFHLLHGVSSRWETDCNLWDFSQGVWRTDGPVLDGVELPPTHLIGLGAVGAAFAFALASSPGLRGRIIGIDPQATSETDRNRLLSALHADVGASKVRLGARLFEGAAIEFYPNPTTWPEYAADSTRYSPAGVRVDEDRFRYKWIISCVDRNIHRQNIARYLPRHVLSGSTDGLVAQATYYSTIGPCECFACNHPVPHFDMHELVAHLQVLSREERLKRYAVIDLPPAKISAIEEYLARPSCDHPAEAEIRRLGVEGAPDWSVGFVAAAAGIMLAAYQTRCAIEGVDRAIGAHSERRLIFQAAPELTRSKAQRKVDCELCAKESTGQRFARRWSGAC